MNENNFGEKIRLLRTSRGLTMKDIEDCTGIGHSTISRWEQGACEPTSPQIIKDIAEFFEVDKNYLLGINPNPGDDPQPRNTTTRLNELETMVVNLSRILQFILTRIPIQQASEISNLPKDFFTIKKG